jgi:predicted DNA-binding protein
MGIRTVRLDDETEKVLKQVTQKTGWSVSAALKRGLLVLRDEVTRRATRLPFEVYRRLDLGPGGYAIGPSTETRRGMQDALRRKRRR